MRRGGNCNCGGVYEGRQCLLGLERSEGLGRDSVGDRNAPMQSDHQRQHVIRDGSNRAGSF